MTYREYLHKLCTETDMNDKDDVTRLVQFLLQEAVEYNEISIRHEEKIKEIMSAKDFEEYTDKLADEMTKEWINNLPDCSLKDFAIKNLDIIMDDSMTREEALSAIREREDI